MNQSIDIVIKQKLPKEKTVINLPVGSVIQFEGGAVGLICWEYIVIINTANGKTCLNIHNKSSLTKYEKRLGTLAGITVQED